MKQQVMILIVAGLIQCSLLPIAMGAEDDGAFGDRMLAFDAVDFEGTMTLAIPLLHAACGWTFGAFDSNMAFRAVITMDARPKEGNQEKGGIAMKVTAPYARLGRRARYEVSLAKISSLVDPGGDQLAKKLGLDEAIHIVLPEQNTWYIVYPKLRAYAVLDQVPFTLGMTLGEEERPTKFKKKVGGEEKIGDLLCVKSQAHIEFHGGDYHGTQWEAKAFGGLPIRNVVEDEGEHIEVQLADVTMTKPPQTAFEPPGDYKRYSWTEFRKMIESKIRQIPLTEAPTPH